MDLFKLFVRIAADTSDADEAIDRTGKKTSNLGSKIKSGLGTAAKVAGAAIAASATAVSALVTSAVKGYADYEQLVGGVDTLFKDSNKKVMGYAAEAYKTAGLSANQYMEQVTSFSASLLQSLGGDTDKAADVANRAVIDMADNANKMGTAMESIQNAYQGFAKQNYTMLDNLKLGYGGTKEEMERLIADASRMTQEQNELNVSVEEGNLSFGNIVNAISVMQKHLDIAGTTADEAASTIQGSISAMKSAWQNLVVGIADDTQNFDKLVTEFVDSVGTVADNVIPRVEKALGGVANLIEKLAPKIVQKLPSLVQSLLPGLLSAAGKLIDSVIDVLPSLLETLVAEIPTLIDMIISSLFDRLPELLPAVISALTMLIDGLGEALQSLIPALFEAAMGMIRTLLDDLPSLLDSVLDAVQGLVESILELLPSVIGALPEIITGIVEFIVGAIPQLIGAIMDVIDGLFESLPQIISEIVKAVPEIIQGICDALISGLPDILNAVLELIIGIVEDLPNLIITILEAIPDLITGILNAITGNIGQFIEVGFDLFVAIIEALPKIIVEIVKAVPAIVVALVKAIVESFGALSDAGEDMFSGLSDGAARVGEKLAEKIGPFFAGIWESITDWFADIWESVSGFFVGIWEYVSGVFETIWAGIQEFLDRPGYYIGLAIGTVIDAIVEFFTVTIPQAWQDFKTWISDTIAEGIEWLAKKKDEIVEAIPRIWEDIKKKVSEGIAQVRDTIVEFFTVAIPQKWEDFKQDVSKKISEIGDWFADLPNQMLEIGENIVTGLWDGISGAWDWLSENVGGFFGGLVEGVKDGLGIHSPSKVFAGIGGFMAEGLGEGWDDKFGKIRDDIESSLNFNSSVDIATSKQPDTAMYFNVVSPDGKSLARFVAPYMGAQLQLVGG